MRKMAELERGNLRDATEKSWGATLRATNALILATKLCKELDGAKEGLLWNFTGLLKKIEKLIRNV